MIFYNASKSTFATDVVGCLYQLGASNCGFTPGPKKHRDGPDDILARIADEILAWYQAGYKQLELLACALGRLPGPEIVPV